MLPVTDQDRESIKLFCDKNGFVIAKVTVPGNVHDSVSFFPVYNSLNEKFKDKILRFKKSSQMNYFFFNRF